ncbi:glycosyltransferase family 32 protein, partial [Lentinula aciculospora]
WIIPFSVVIPGVKRKLRLWIPNIRGLHRASLSRFGKKTGSFLIVLVYFLSIFSIFAVAHRFGSKKKTWPGVPSTTLVFEKEDLQRIWEWEIASGHHPSTRPTLALQRSSVPAEYNLGVQPNNPSLPYAGADRVYLDGQSRASSHDIAYPQRPKAGSAADLDVLMRHCDFNADSYVRDCLEVLRIGGGLDNGKRVRRVVPDEWKYVFTEGNNPGHVTSTSSPPPQVPDSKRQGVLRGDYDPEDNSAFTKSRHAAWEIPPISLPPIQNSQASSSCNPEEPRIFHMFWSGDFTDKPYLALISFLYTQNLGLHDTQPLRDICAPKLWLWINPGFMLTLKNAALSREKFEKIIQNQWAAPFLHPRFRNIIEFKFWNTTEQLDGVSELRDVWRSAPTLFNSGGHTIYVPGMPKAWGVQDEETTSAVDNQANATVSTHVNYNEPEKVAVVLSDMARFLLCHRFGGVYLDADTLFLRDWEELWGWKGAFAYRWSWHDNYNTAALKMSKGSALGSFILRTAFKNDFDFHPMTITNYMKDAHMEDLLFRLPDAMFDSAWLNMEGYQHERPPQPYFSRFEEFFETPQQNSATPPVVGFDGFFRGAFSYHFHNSWSRLNDPSRNFPDLGPRFARDVDIFVPKPDPQDFNWSTVLKRTFEAYLRGEIPNMYGEWIKY